VSRRPRIQIPGGTYYLLQVTHRYHPLFVADDCSLLETLLAGAASRTRTQIFAYCWLPHELHLAVRSRDVPVSRFMQGWTGSYARKLHSHSDERGHVFSQRFQSLLIDPRTWLPALVRYIHHAPVRAGCCTTPQAFTNSSHRAYAARETRPWLDTATVTRLLCDQGYAQPQHACYFSSESTAAEIDLFGNTGNPHTRILGDAAFQQALPQAHSPRHPRLTLSQLIDAIALIQDTTREEILSLSRRRAVSLARALIAWHATERRIATLASVAQVVRRDSSTLSKAISRHRQQHPQLFRLDALTHLRPLGS